MGACFLVVNLSSDGLFDASGGCTDPFIRASIASIGTWDTSPLGIPVAYQWLFVLYSGAILVIGFVYMTSKLHQNDPKHRAQSVYRYISALASSPETVLAGQALQRWRIRSRGCITTVPVLTVEHLSKRVPLWRRILFYIFHLPILFLASIPAVGYVSKHVNAWL